MACVLSCLNWFLSVKQYCAQINSVLAKLLYSKLITKHVCDYYTCVMT